MYISAELMRTKMKLNLSVKRMMMSWTVNMSTMKWFDRCRKCRGYFKLRSKIWV